MIFAQNGCVDGDNFVYLNKIFYNNQENASPIMASLDTSAGDFTQQLTIGANNCNSTYQVAPASSTSCGCSCGSNSVSNYGGGCGCNSGSQTAAVNSYSGSNGGCGCNSNYNNGGCGCNCCCDFQLTAETTFEITNAYVIVHSLVLSEAAELTAEDVTVEGLPITALTRNGNQFVGDLSGIMAEITRCACHSPCENICPGNFVMITTDGPWSLQATIVVEGVAYNNGPTCSFKLCFNTADDTPFAVTGGASFAFCGVEIPCQVSGIAPSLIFDFNACAKLLNPTITVTCTGEVCTPTLTGSLVVTPGTNLQVTRPSLFNIGACEVKTECDDLGECNPCNPNHEQCIDSNNCCCYSI